MHARARVCACVCVCVRERERERERDMCVCVCVSWVCARQHAHRYFKKEREEKREKGEERRERERESSEQSHKNHMLRWFYFHRLCCTPSDSTTRISILPYSQTQQVTWTKIEMGQNKKLVQSSSTINNARHNGQTETTTINNTTIL